jgi:acetyl esterase
MRKTGKRLFVMAMLLALPAGALAIEGFTPDRMVVYKKTDDTALKLHIFEPPDHKAADRCAAIVFFFGGGWNGGSPSQFFPHCEHLASRGMVAMAAEYRVKKRNGTTPRECVMDGKSAVRWIRQHAAELGADPDRIAAGGGSAGGHVAAAIGNCAGFDEPGEDTRVSARPGALVLFNPVFDNSREGYGYDRVKDYWREISPLHNIDENSPPAIVFLGTKDKLIPVETAKMFRDKMKASGVRCDLHLYEGQEHGFFNYSRNRKIYNLTIEAMDRFLESLGYFENSPEADKPSDG